MEAARDYLALEEFVGVQIQVLRRKQELQTLDGEAHCGEGQLLKDFLDLIPFDLTGAQKRCIEEIRRDMNSPIPMNRLLQGDVGAGKTMVAFSAMLLAVEAGFQAALMSPTQILAEQHYHNFMKYAQKLDLRISLRTSDRAEDNFAGEFFDQEGDQPQIVIGTHALIHDKVKFENLGLAIIDEQHKFGVSQRGKLAAQGSNPDMLVMTATPIPRTLTMTVYGDLDVSILDEIPSGRGKIITAIRPATKTREATSFIKQQLEEGRQGYIVYPLVEEGGGKSKTMAATKEFEAWRKRLNKYECALLHGKVSGEEKDRLMTDFRDGKIDVLVATTVIEVGVDVPNSNIMIIYNAERFGLAQLHQLRGRIGRGEHKSYCILMCDPKAEEAMERLKILEETRDGFRIAEEDMKIRGPGDVLGTRQSGFAGFAIRQSAERCPASFPGQRRGGQDPGGRSRSRSPRALGSAQNGGVPQQDLQSDCLASSDLKITQTGLTLSDGIDPAAMVGVWGDGSDYRWAVFSDRSIQPRTLFRVQAPGRCSRH